MTNDAPHKSHPGAATKVQHDLAQTDNARAAAEAFFALWQASLQAAVKPVLVPPRVEE